MTKSKTSAIDKFLALPKPEKEKIVQRLDAENPERQLARSRPLNAREPWQRFKAKAKLGRPKIGKGAKTISLTVERTLLKRADAHAKRHGLTRAKLIAQALQSYYRRRGVSEGTESGASRLTGASPRA